MIRYILAAIAALALAAPAAADNDSYLAKLHELGFATMAMDLWNPQGQINAGIEACTDLRNGFDPPRITSMRWGGGPQIAQAAREELCPDVDA